MTASAKKSKGSPVTFRDRVEAAGAHAILGVFRGLSPARASALGTRLLATLGPRLGAHRVARDNLRLALPGTDATGQERILRGMWENLGRTLGELCHLETLTRLENGHVEVVGRDIAEDLLARGGPVVFFGGHLGNWEISPWIMGQLGLPMNVFFRAPNNPLIFDLYSRIRQGAGGDQLPKGRDGARRAMVCLKKGEHLGVLADQKMNDGIPVPFFGRDAMTAPALAQLALRFRAPIVPLRSQRLDGTHHRLTLYPPIELAANGTHHADIADIMHTVNATLEDWIRETPEQWLWVHRRWPKA